jgi:thiol-disulfide isomerase/thioredoxin
MAFRTVGFIRWVLGLSLAMGTAGCQREPAGPKSSPSAGDSSVPQPSAPSSGETTPSASESARTPSARESRVSKEADRAERRDEPSEVAKAVSGEPPQPGATEIGGGAEKKAEAASEPTPAQASELLEQALAAAKDEDYARALQLAQEAAKLEPTNHQIQWVLLQLAVVRAADLVQQNQFEEAAQVAQEGIEVGQKLSGRAVDPSDGVRQFLQLAYLYRATALAGQQKEAEASEAVRAAVQAGFTQLQVLREAAEFEQLRKLPQFETLIAESSKSVAKQWSEQIEKLMAAQRSFPFDFELKDLDGKVVKRSDFHGKVLLVDIWGTWCPPCRRAIPHLVELYHQYQAQGLEMVGINYEEAEREEEARQIVRKFVEEHKIPYPCVIGTEEVQQQIPAFRGYPTVLLLDRSGKVRLVLVGYHSKEYLELAVQKLLAESSTATPPEAGEPNRSETHPGKGTLLAAHASGGEVAPDLETVSSGGPQGQEARPQTADRQQQPKEEHAQGEPQGKEKKTHFETAAEHLQQGKVAEAVAAAEQGYEQEPFGAGALRIYMEALLAQAGQQLAQNDAAGAAQSFERIAVAIDRYAMESKTRDFPAFRQRTKVLALATSLYATASQTERAVATARRLLEEVKLSELEALRQDATLRKVLEHQDLKQELLATEKRLQKQVVQEVDQLLARHEPFPFDFELKDIEGKTVRLADFRGKVLLVDIWGTWCGPCVRAVPHLVELHRKYRDKGLEILGINYEMKQGEEAAAVVKKFRDKAQLTYACALGSQELLKQVPNFQGFPTILLFDPDGKVRAKLVGYQPPLVLETLVERLLKENERSKELHPSSPGSGLDAPTETPGDKPKQKPGDQPEQKN